MSGCRPCWGHPSQSTKVRGKRVIELWGVWGARVGASWEPGNGVEGWGLAPFPSSLAAGPWLLPCRLPAAPGPQHLTGVRGSRGAVPGHHGATGCLQEVGSTQWDCGRAVPMLTKGMPELGWWQGMIPAPSPHPAPCWEGQVQPQLGPVGSALLCCSRDPRCQFQEVDGHGGSFPAMRLCNSYWSREVQGRECWGPEDMAGWPGVLHSLLYVTEDPKGV